MGTHPTCIEFRTNENIDRLELTVDLLSLSCEDIQEYFKVAANERFQNKTRVMADRVECMHKSLDFDLSYHIDDHELYEHWETKVGAYRMFNGLIEFKYGRRPAKIIDTNNRLDHKLLGVQRECLRFIRGRR